MTDIQQHWLSGAYGSLKTKYYLLKRVSGNAEKLAQGYEVMKDRCDMLRKKNTELGSKCVGLEGEVNMLRRRIRELEDIIDKKKR